MGWLVLIFGAIAIARIADVEGRSGGLWACIAIASCLLGEVLLPQLPMINLMIGLGATFFVMFALNFVQPGQTAAITR